MATRRSEPSGATLSVTTMVLVLGDVAAIGAFVFLGEIRHYPFAVAVSRTPGTLVPFLVGWVVSAPLTGVYDGRIRRTRRVLALRTGIAWVGATVLAMTLRATPVFHGNADLTFALVAGVVGLGFVLPWRLLVATLLDG